MKTCKTCKYWELNLDYKSARVNYQYELIPGTGKCLRVPMWWETTEWACDEDKSVIHRKLRPEYIGRLAFVQDGSDYYAELRTLPDFGCVQHEDAT